METGGNGEPETGKQSVDHVDVYVVLLCTLISREQFLGLAQVAVYKAVHSGKVGTWVVLCLFGSGVLGDDGHG